jgi:hypothetical protein
MRAVVLLAVFLMAGCASTPSKSGDIVLTETWKLPDKELAVVVGRAIGSPVLTPDAPAPGGDWDLEHSGLLSVEHERGERVVQVWLQEDAVQDPEAWLTQAVASLVPGTAIQLESMPDGQSSRVYAFQATPIGAHVVAYFEPGRILTLYEAADMANAVKGVTTNQALDIARADSVGWSNRTSGPDAVLGYYPAAIVHGRLAYWVNVAWPGPSALTCDDDVRTVFVDAQNGAVLDSIPYLASC